MSVEELQAYLGFMIVMGIVKLPSLYDYWKNDPYYYYTPIVDRISRDRSMDISQYLHFVDNAMLALPGIPQYDCLGKVRLILEFIYKKFLTLYNSNSDNTIVTISLDIHFKSSLDRLFGNIVFHC